MIRRRPGRLWRRVAAAAVAMSCLLAASGLVGCEGGVPLQYRLGKPVFPGADFEETGSATLTADSRLYPGERLRGRFDYAVYAENSQDNFTALLLEGDPDDPDAATVLQFFWRPKPALTPLEPEAINCTVHYVVFKPSQRVGGEEAVLAAEEAGEPLPEPIDPSGESVGVYAGAGFVLTDRRPGRERLTGDLLDASMFLSQASPGFSDPLGEARVRGRLTLLRDRNELTLRMRQINRLVAERLGYPSLVDATTHARPATLAAR